MDYKNGKIYKIVCNETGDIYIGSTTQPLYKRLSKHKSCYKSFLEGKYGNLTSFKILEKKNYDIVLIEEYPCENKQQLHSRERYYIDNCICVNKNIPSRNIKEYQQLYNEENKDKIKEYHKKYYEKNIDKIKEYRELNKEDINRKIREYRRLNKDEINKKRKEKYHLRKIQD